MKTKFMLYVICCSLFIGIANAQENKDTSKVINLKDITISVPRTDVKLNETPAAVSLVNKDQLGTLSKSIAADEALRLVPGVRVDNGTDGSRVHLYIRGQGVLSESGFRGISVFVDGIPVNDPGGYAPDMYDVDWSNVDHIEVIKGLACSMYGAGATGGVVNIYTEDGGKKPISESFSASAGSYGFWKMKEQVDGTQGNVNYRISYSHMQGNGYRSHQAFYGDNFSEKLTWKPSNKIKVTQLLSYSDYFNQNSEGMNLARIQGKIIGLQSNNMGWRASNNDAIPYNEFHKTQRLTGATIIKYAINKDQDITMNAYSRLNNYRETSNNGDDYKPYINPGVSAQYNFNCGKEKLKYHLSLGADIQYKTMYEHVFAVPGEYQRDSNRVDTHFGEESFDLGTILINQIIRQKGVGAFLLNKFDISKKLFVTANVRYDYVRNQVENNLPVPDSLSLSGTRTFKKPTFSIGIAYDACKFANVYANWGTGFLIPTNDELFNNPEFWGGLNTSIEPATSQGGEIGVRGDIGKKVYYDITAFSVKTKNGFYRFSIPGRGNNTAFFGNIGESKFGLETYISYQPMKNLKFDVAYTYSHFIYPAHDSVLDDHFIPNCPQHALTAEVAVKLMKDLTLAINDQFVSEWRLQVDDSIYNNYTIGATYYQPKMICSSKVPGYNIIGAQLTYNWKLGKMNGDISLYVKNIFDKNYYGFTEPNNYVDYNSYQPAPGREFFVSLKMKI